METRTHRTRLGKHISRHIAHFTALALVSSFVLSACGIRGKLETPPPLWGDKAKQDQAEKQKAEKPQAEKQKSNN
ncbi:MAG: hypothetical protein COA69_13750 [Robiginitomaculum sp.]|nr:MAG: hypothetical protein COA69_13750 [Robiginitomaculum sp.]